MNCVVVNVGSETMMFVTLIMLCTGRKAMASRQC